MITLSQIRREVREEIRTAGILDVPPTPSLPPPRDIEAEQDVCAAILTGQYKPKDFAPLEAKHFFSRFYATIFATIDSLCEVGVAPSRYLLLRALEYQGCVGPELDRELDIVEFETPFVLHVRDKGARIVELFRMRALCMRMHHLDRAIRSGCMDLETALGVLGEIAT